MNKIHHRRSGERSFRRLIGGKVFFRKAGRHHAADGFIQLIRNHRLQQIIRSTVMNCALCVRKVIIAADDNKGGARISRRGLTKELRAIHHRHLHINKNKIRMKL